MIDGFSRSGQVDAAARTPGRVGVEEGGGMRDEPRGRPPVPAAAHPPADVLPDLQDAALWAVTHVRIPVECGIMVRSQDPDGTVVDTVVGTDAGSLACVRVEQDGAAGPGGTAMEGLQAVLLGDVEDAHHWSAWLTTARRHGVRSCLAVPAHVTDGVDLALLLYSGQLDPWDTTTVLGADGAAQHLARDIQLHQRLTGLTQEVERVRAAVAARDVVDQAVGILMVRRTCSAAVALAHLRRAASDRGIPTSQVAAEVVAELTAAVTAERATGVTGAAGAAGAADPD